MKTLITNSEISRIFEKTGINIGITFPILKDFHNCYLSAIILLYKRYTYSEKITTLEQSLIPFSTFKKIASFGGIDVADSSFLKFLHFKTEKKILAFLRHSKNKIKNGKLMLAWKEYLHSKGNKVSGSKLFNTLWFIIESRVKKSNKESSVKIVSNQSGGSKLPVFLKDSDLDLDNFNKVLCEIGIISDSEQSERSDSDTEFIKWAANQIKLRT
jgi:hypothetical protein